MRNGIYGKVLMHTRVTHNRAYRCNAGDKNTHLTSNNELQSRLIATVKILSASEIIIANFYPDIYLSLC